MKAALLVAAVLATSTVAHAGFIQPPTGFPPDSEQATLLAAKANAVSHFGGAPAVATVEVYRFPDAAGSLVVTTVFGTLTDHREEAVRVAVDSFHAGPTRAQLGTSKVRVDRWEEAVDPKDKQIVARLDWRDDDAKAVTHAVLVIAADAGTVVAVTAECVTGAATTPAHTAACIDRLKTVDPGIAPDKRVVLGLAPAGSEPPPGPNATGPKPSMRPPSTMSDGSQAPIAPITVQRTETKRTTDKRPVYVGLGIVVLAALFWWNRRRRERFEKEPNVDDK